MGRGTFDADSYSAYSSFTASTKGKTTDEVYSSRNLHDNLNPKGVKMRESRDSAENPNSTPIIVGIDVTGSMGFIADYLAREGLGTLFTGILDRKPITDPHLMFMAIGDANYDQAPLQVSQFEADKRIIEQLAQIYIEHGGGGNDFESYDLPWYFAAAHTVHDAMEKRGKRGYLFTVGDEQAPRGLSKNQIDHFIGDSLQSNLSPADALAMAQRKYDVFHIVVEEGSHAKTHMSEVMSTWTDLLGQRVIRLKDHRKLSETIVSAIEVVEGANAEASAHAWGHGTAAIVHEAVKNLPKGNSPKLLGRSK